MEDRVTVSDAAALLGVTEGAIRKRIARGTLSAERVGGRVWVYIPPGTHGQDTGQPAGQDNLELVEEMRSRISYLERQVEEEREARRRADTLLARLMDRVPELEAPQDARQEDAGEPSAAQGEDTRQDTGQDVSGPQDATQRRSWLSRFFFGPE